VAVTKDTIGYGVFKKGDVIKSITIGGETKQITRRYQMIDRMLNVRKGDTVRVTVERDGAEKVLSFTFDKDKMFNVCIRDEGAPEAFASHNLGTHTGRTTDINYIAYMFEQGASKTNVLTEEKLVLFAERYAGKAAQLVAHEGVDDGVYGSLAVYREEILQELKKWKADNGEKAFEDILKKALTGNPSYKTTLEEIGSQL